MPDTSLWNQAGPGGLQSPEARQFFYLHILPCVSRPFSWGIIARLSSQTLSAMGIIEVSLLGGSTPTLLPEQARTTG